MAPTDRQYYIPYPKDRKEEQDDHTLFVGKVVEAGVQGEDQVILMRDHNLNYGG